MLKFNSTTFSARAWAIPALSGLFVLHQDFGSPRLVRVVRLLWNESDVEVTLQYGVGNISGHVSTSTDLVVTLYRTGAVGVREIGEPALPATSTMVPFLAGEIAREALRWGEARTAWLEGDLDDEARLVVLSLVTAAAGIDIDDMQTVVAKHHNEPSRLRGVQLKSASLTVELIPVTTYGVSITVSELEFGRPKWRRYVQEDVRDARTQLPLHPVVWQKRMLTGLRAVLLLPMDFLLYLFDKASTPSAADRAGFVEYLPSALVDPHAGDTLSALSNSHQ